VSLFQGFVTVAPEILLIYDRVSVKADGRDIYNYEILLSTTDFVKEYYGEVFFND